MNAREFFEGGHVIQANPLLHTLRNGRRFVLFSFVFLLAVQALLFALDIMYHHGVFVAKDAIPPFGYGIVLFALIPIIYMYQERYWKRIEHRRNASANGDYTLLAAEQPWIFAFCRKVMELNFAKDQDINQPASIAPILTELGLTPETILEQAQSEKIKAGLREQTDAARAKGIFGAPTFFVGGEMFWGNDRLDDALLFALDQRTSQFS